MKVSVRELKAGLSHYLSRAHAGETITITSRGRSVARLVPEAASSPKSVDRQELIRRLERMPGVQLALPGKPRGARRPIVIKPGQKTLAEIVIEDRR
jgi:prevent-host-death family protein